MRKRIMLASGARPRPEQLQANQGSTIKPSGGADSQARETTAAVQGESSAQPESDLAEALARAREVRPKLSEATDKLNKSIAEAEQAIAALQLGVRASVEMYSGPDHNPWYTNLVFGKDGKAWRLFIASGHPSHPEEELTLLTNASREYRLRAVELLPELVRELIVTAEMEVERVERKANEVRGFVASITRESAK